MNDSERRLIRFVCDGDMRNAQKAVKIILDLAKTSLTLRLSDMNRILASGWIKTENRTTSHTGCRCLNRL